MSEQHYHQHATSYQSTSNEQSSSNMTTCHIKHRIDTCEEANSSDGSGSEEDILHVVTNVYTIPINNNSSKPILASLAENSGNACLDNANATASSIGVKISNNSNSLSSMCYQPVTAKDSCHVFKRVACTSSSEQASKAQQPCADLTKSKFQIRSIVEIYESDHPPPPSRQQSAAAQDLAFYKKSTQVNETTTKEVIPLNKTCRDERQKQLNVEEETGRFNELRVTMSEWLLRAEKSLREEEVKLTFLPEMEEQHQKYKDLQSTISREKKSLLEQIQQEYDEIYSKSISASQDLVSPQMRSDLKTLQTRYQSMSDAVGERLTKLERMISDLRKYQDEFIKTLNHLKQIETNLQIEHQSSSGFGSASYGKSLEEQLANLKQVKYDLESLSSNVGRLNDLAGKLLGTPNHNARFTAKLKADVNDLNEKVNQLRSLHLKRQYHLEDALAKANKVDSELDELENWISYKDHEVLEDEGVVITEEQFDQRVVKYKQVKAEIERKEPQVRRSLEAGNEMLRSPDLANANDLAKSLSNLNLKWTSLNKKIDAKNHLFAQLSEYINELRQLLHQENSWLAKAQQKLNASRLGADAEELSEELDSLERFLKAHTHQTKERINELSALLIEKNILIQLANSDVKEFLFKWHLIHEDASRKLQSLDKAINEVQNWEHCLLELQEWVSYMEKYLSTRLDQDLFASDIGDDEFNRIQTQFGQNERTLKELEDSVEKYKLSGNSASSRLEQQLGSIKLAWADLQHKWRKFQKPADFDPKLNRVRKQLDDVEQLLHLIEIDSEDSDAIHMQLEHCMKFYKTLSELKGQIEFVLKQGRTIVDKKQVDNTEELTCVLDGLKLKYNQLGSRVTNAKNDLEKAFKLAKRFRKEYSLIVDFLSKIDGELRKIEQKPLSKNYNDELDWIKNTKNEINKVETINLETMRNLRKSLEEIVRAQQNAAAAAELNSKNNNLNGATLKITEIEQKVSNIQRRVDERAAFLHDQAKKLDEGYEAYFVRSRPVLLQIERLQNDLIEAERFSSRAHLDRVEKEVNSSLLTEIESVKLQGFDLCSKSEQYSKSVEADLRNLIVNYENLVKRLDLAHERFLSSCEEKQLQEFVETTRRQARNESYKATTNRRAKSPSESSVDSTLDMLDSELKQKYMRAVAYLRLLDESSCAQEGEECAQQQQQLRQTTAGKYKSSNIDIDYVIQQARHVAKIYEDSDPDRSRRILEKVYKLEKRWSEAKNKRDSFKSSSKLFEQFTDREGCLRNNIHIIESMFSYKENEEEPKCIYGPSDFIYDADFCQYTKQQQNHQQQSCHQQRRFEKFQDVYDTHSIVSECAANSSPLTRTIIVKEVPVEPQINRTYKITKTTTTTQHGLPPPQPPPITSSFDPEYVKQSFAHFQHQVAMQQQKQQQQQQQQQQKRVYRSSSQFPEHPTVDFQVTNRSSSIPASQRTQFSTDDGNLVTTETVTNPNSTTTTRYFTTRKYTTENTNPQDWNGRSAAASPKHYVDEKSTSSASAATNPNPKSFTPINQTNHLGNQSAAFIDHSNFHLSNEAKPILIEQQKSATPIHVATSIPIIQTGQTSRSAFSSSQSSTAANSSGKSKVPVR